MYNLIANLPNWRSILSYYYFNFLGYRLRGKAVIYNLYMSKLNFDRILQLSNFIIVFFDY